MPWTDDDRKLRIFLSVDVVGSTAYKTKTARAAPANWPRFYNIFVEDFHTTLAGYIDEVGVTHNAPPHKLTLWKLLGDEILYSAILTNEQDAFFFTKAFHRAVYSYDRAIEDQHGLRIKGTAWVAGFPIRNSEIKPQNLNSTSDGIGETTIPEDYIGLDLDIGFRLSHTSRAGRMVISMDLADLLARNQDSNLRLFHVGWERFKGVFDNQPYPVIWVAEPDKIPDMTPWQEFDCPFTRSFVKEKNNGQTEDNAAAILELLKKIRGSLPDLQLFPPYFQDEDMPKFHQAIWEGQREKDQIEESTDVLQGASPFGEEIPESKNTV